MKEIRKEIWDLHYQLDYSWYSIRPSYFNLWCRDLFDIDLDIFSEMEYIIGR